MARIQALSTTHSPYSATNARNQIRNKSAEKHYPCSSFGYLTLHFWIILHQGSTRCYFPRRYFSQLPLDTCSKWAMSIIADSGSENVAPFARSRWQKPTSIRRRTIVEKWVQQTRSKTMDAAFKKAIDNDGLRAHQVVLLSNILSRLDITQLPLIKLTELEFIKSLLGGRLRHNSL